MRCNNWKYFNLLKNYQTYLLLIQTRKGIISSQEYVSPQISADIAI